MPEGFRLPADFCCLKGGRGHRVLAVEQRAEIPCVQRLPGLLLRLQQIDLGCQAQGIALDGLHGLAAERVAEQTLLPANTGAGEQLQLGRGWAVMRPGSIEEGV